jgi:hypothetical protein
MSARLAEARLVVVGFGTYPIRGKTLRSGPPASRPTIQDRVIAGSVIYADEASCWDTLHARYLTKRINHSEAYSTDGACTNQAESFFSRLRRAEIGIHHTTSPVRTSMLTLTKWLGARTIVAVANITWRSLMLH